MQVTLFDRSTYKISAREYTDEGFLRVPGRVARSGIQQYLASELGLDGEQSRVVNVYRPPEEVFNQDSLATYNGAVVTDDHPEELVNPSSYRVVTIGNVLGAGAQDGDFVIAPLVVRDAEAIKKIESGKAELSAGYTAEYKDEKGTTPEGQEYEFIQRDIKINHVALVDNARAGAMARIFDKQVEAKKMAKVTLDNGRAIEVEDAVAAQVEDSIQRLKDLAATKEKNSDKLQAQLDSATEELSTVKAKATDEAISARVAEVTAALDSARKLVKDLTVDSVDPVEIKRSALAALKTEKDWSDKSAAYIEAAFDMEMEKKEEIEDEEEEEGKAAADSLKKLAQDMSADTDVKVVESPRAAYKDNLSNAWKKTAGENA